MATHRTALALALALMIGARASAEAQEVPGHESDSPEVVACALFRHLESDRWDAAAALYHERFLEHWHRRLIRDLPSEGESDRLDRNSASPSRDFWLRKQMAVASVEELKALSPPEAAARALEAYDPAYQCDVTLENPRLVGAWERDELARGYVPAHTRPILGSVVHGDRAYVGYRRVSGPGPGPDPSTGPPWGHFWPVHLLAMTRSEGGWKAWPSDHHRLLEKSYEFSVGPPIEGPAHTPTPCPHPPDATAAPTDEAQTYAGQFLDLVDRERWPDAARFFANDVLADWYEENLDRLAAMRARNPEIGTFVSSLFAGIDSLEELEQLSPREAATWNLERMREGVSRGREGGPRAELRSEVLGTISEGDLAHVLYRIRRTFRESGPEGRRVEIAPLRARTVTLRRTATGWTVLPRVSVLLDESPGD
ncbi:MAG: hypothetical protein KY397_06055 [Gemmatimonadetes bacterium]|nr:hypothetical protein [Gemmatimonadota bacterium]